MSCENNLMEKGPLETRPFSLVVDGFEIRGEMTFPGRGRNYPPLIICHGIPQQRQAPSARNEGYRLLAGYFARRGFPSIIFNFRGTGFSQGSFDLWGWRRDLEAVILRVVLDKNLPGNEVSLLGFSGGAATSCLAAARRPEVARLILAACPADFDFLFDRQPAPELIEEARSIGIMRDEELPLDPRAWAQEQKRFRPVEYIQEISPRPLLLIHGQEDDLVVEEHAHRLYEAAGEPKELILLPKAPHQLRALPEVWEACCRWLEGQLDKRER